MTTDEQLVARAQRGDTRALELLVDLYEPVAIFVAADYYSLSGDREDLRQEARIGILNAVRDYKPGGSAFRNFAFLCCKRQVITAVMTATRGKHETLTHAVRAIHDEHGEEFDAVDSFPDPSADPVEILAERDQLRALVQAIRDGLSPLERDWLVEVVFCGRSYAGLDSFKVADNALQRARRKLAAVLTEVDDVPLGRAA